MAREPLPPNAALDNAAAPQEALSEERRRLIEDIAWLVLRRLRRSDSSSGLPGQEAESPTEG